MDRISNGDRGDPPVVETALCVLCESGVAGCRAVAAPVTNTAEVREWTRECKAGHGRQCHLDARGRLPNRGYLGAAILLLQLRMMMMMGV